MVVEPSLQDESEFLYAAQPELLRFKTTQLVVEKVMDWYQTRAEEIEHHAGQVRAGGSCRSEMPAAALGPEGSVRAVAASSGARVMCIVREG